MTDLELLKAARKLIEDAPKLLTDNRYNDRKDHDDFKPKCFCSIGAMWYADAPNSQKMSNEREYHYARLFGFENPSLVTDWNDHVATKQDVLDKFDEAIKRLEASA